MDELENLKLFYKSEHKESEYFTAYAEYQGEAVVVKRGGEEVHREAIILRRLHGMTLPKLIDSFEKDGVGYLIIERLAGQPLSQRIDLKSDWTSLPMPKSDAISLIGEIAKSFSEVNSSGYYYRDLNLAHILVSEDGIKLVDHEANVSFDTNGAAIVDNLAGTWETMAPEEFELGSCMTEASQVFTLGTVLHQLVIGSSLFYIDPEEVEDTVARRANTKEKMRAFTAIDMGDERLNYVINKSLNFRASERFSSIERFISALNS